MVQFYVEGRDVQGNASTYPGGRCPIRGPCMRSTMVYESGKPNEIIDTLRCDLLRDDHRDCTRPRPIT